MRISKGWGVATTNDDHVVRARRKYDGLTGTGNDFEWSNVISHV
jgi:hypothetical protein